MLETLEYRCQEKREMPELALVVGFKHSVMAQVAKSYNLLRFDVVAASSQSDAAVAMRENEIDLVVVSAWQEPELRAWVKKTCKLNKIRYLDAKSLFC